MEEEVRSFVYNYLGRPASSSRFLTVILDLEDRKEPDKKLVYDPFEYLDSPLIKYLNLSMIKTDEELIAKANEDSFASLCTRFLIQHEKDFQSRHLKKSRDLPKYLYKYVNLQEKIFQKITNLSLHDFINLFNLMYNEDVNDGILFKKFLLLVRDDEWLIAGVVNEMQPNVLEFLLYNIQNSGHEGEFCSHQRIQQTLPLNTCDISGDFRKIEVFLKFGHENYFNKNYLLSSIQDVWKKFFGQSFRRIQSKIIGIFLLKRLYLILMMYRAFDEEESGPRDAMLTVVKKLWRALPDTFITSQEIKDTLGVLAPTKMQKHIELFLFYFEQEFGDCNPTPRSLIHLSRCTIRRAINVNGKLPEGVEHLPIPEKAKRYLLLET